MQSLFGSAVMLAFGLLIAVETVFSEPHACADRQLADRTALAVFTERANRAGQHCVNYVLRTVHDFFST